MLLPLLVSLTAQLTSPPAGATHSGRQSQLRVAVPRIDGTATIDGHLDEAAWAAAARLTDFSLYSPVDGAPAEDATEVLVWYSPSAIHFGIRAQASSGTVRATLANRDKIEADDSIQIFLSTYNDGRQAFVFEVNPLGVQADGTLVEGARTAGAAFGTLETGRGETDRSADYVFDSKGRLTDEGYTVEMRIPFKSLRYQSAPSQDWGVNVIRRVQSRGHEHSWTAARRNSNSFLAQSGTLSGLTGLRPGLVLDLNPVVTAKIDGTPAADDHWSYDADTSEFGGNVRWGVTPNLTLNGTVNPDFSQVEADAGQFTFDPRSAVFFPEKRPFFLDGIEQFTTPNRLIYTRRIVAPIFAAKLTGKVSETGIAFLSSLDRAATSATGENRPFFNLLRVQHDLAGQSKLGVVYTDKIEGGYSNRVAGLDARIAFADIYTVDLQAAASRTRAEGRTATGPLWEATFDRNGRRFGLRYDLIGIDEGFRADAGFVARPAIARANLDHRLSWFGKKGSVFERFNTDVVLNGVWRYRDFVSGGQALEQKLHLNNSADLRGGWKAGASVLIEEFRYDEDLYADYALLKTTAAGVETLPFVGTPAIKNLDWVLSLDTPQFRTFSGSLFLLWGRDENFFEWSPADIVYATLSLDWRPTEQFRANAGYQLQQFKRRSDGTTVGRRQIPRLKVEYQLTRSISFRVVGEYDSSVQDDLRDDTRTELPIVIKDSAGVYRRALGIEQGRLRLDCLFSYQPNPGTVVFAGYGSTHEDPESRRSGSLRRTTDGFFLKISYLFRL